MLGLLLRFIGAKQNLAATYCYIAMKNHEQNGQPASQIIKPCPDKPGYARKEEVAFASRLSFTLVETAEITGFSERTIRRFVERGLLHPVKASHRLIFSKTEIERFLNAMTNG